MRWTHMSAWDQEEYALGQRTPEMMQHLTKCAACRGGVEQLAKGVALFRDSAMEWSAECLEARLQAGPVVPAPSKRATVMVPALRWALAAVLLALVLVPLARVLFYKTAGPRTAVVNSPLYAPPAHVAVTDDALLEEVDQQVSEAVPDSMEPLTHLATTSSLGREVGGEVGTERGGGQYVERN